jgi:hypothetical protein
MTCYDKVWQEMKVRYKGAKYTLDCNIESLQQAIADEINIPIDQQILSLGSAPFKLISGHLPDNTVFLLKSRDGKHSYDRSSQIELLVKDEYDNECYFYISKGAKFSDFRSRLESKGFTRVVSKGRLQYNEDIALNEDTIFYAVPDEEQVLFVTTMGPESLAGKRFEPQTYCVNFSHRTTVLELKQQIAAKTGFNTSILHLWSQDKELEDSTVVSNELKCGDKLSCEFNRKERLNRQNQSNGIIKFISETLNNALNDKRRLGNSINFGIKSAFCLGACSYIANLMSSRSYISKKIVPSAKICIAASIIAGIISGIGKYTYNGPSNHL